MSIYETIKDDKRLSGINLTEKNALKLAHYLDELDNCANCKSLATCQNSFAGMEPFIISDDEVVYRPCKKKRVEMLLDNVDSKMGPSFIKEARFESYNQDSEARKKALDYALKYMEGKEEKGLYLIGPFACGKTYYLSALANELALKNIKSSFVFLPDLARMLKNAITDNTLEDEIEKLKKVDVLILDDLGGEMMSSWLRDEIIMPVLQHRLMNHKACFISSNLNYQNLTTHFAESKNDVDSVKANRIVERIKQMTKRLVL